MSPDLQAAYDIVERVAPWLEPERSCILVAAATAGMRGYGVTDIRVGAVFWPAYFSEHESLGQALTGGWGVQYHSAHDGSFVLNPNVCVDEEDGSFDGHCWLETPDGLVVDLMHGLDGEHDQQVDADFRLVRAHIHRPRLEISVKRAWRPVIRAALVEGRQSRISSSSSNYRQPPQSRPLNP